MNVADLTKPIGFLTVIEVPELGYCGGLLLVNSLGRPVEFHCTAPVPENKTQRILYGKTYESFLFCDQIGRALIAKSRQKSAIVVVDRPELKGMNESLDVPLLIAERTGEMLENSGSDDFVDSFVSGDFTVRVLGDSSNSVSVARAFCDSLQQAIPLDEPFERIRQAVDEAQSVIR